MDALELEEFGLQADTNTSSSSTSGDDDMNSKSMKKRLTARDHNTREDWRDLGLGFVKKNHFLIPHVNMADMNKKNLFGLPKFDFSTFDNVINFGQLQGHRLPVFSVLLTLVQIAILVVLMIKYKVEPITDNAMIGPPLDIINEIGGKDGHKIKNQYQLYRLISAFVFHQGILHLLFTLLWQLNLVLNTEKQIGSIKIGIIYIASGIGGNLMSAVFLMDSVSVGATSCLIGVISALLSSVLFNYFAHRAERPWKLVVSYLFQVALFLAIGYIPIVDNFSNFGGAINGFLLGIVLTKQERNFSKKVNFLLFLLRMISLMLLAVFYIVLFAMLYQRVNFKCKACYIINPDWDFFN